MWCTGVYGYTGAEWLLPVDKMYISECFLDSNKLDGFASKISSTSTTSDLTCSLDGHIWTMTLSCPNNQVWSDTRMPAMTYTCSCDGGQWPVDNGRCVTSTDSFPQFCFLVFTCITFPIIAVL